MDGSSRHKLYLMEKKTDKEKTEKAKRKALQEELVGPKKKKGATKSCRANH